MDFSASTDLNDLVEEASHIIIPRTPRRPAKSPLLIDPISFPSNFSTTVKKSTKPKFDIDNLNRLNITYYKPQERVHSKKTENSSKNWNFSTEGKQTDLKIRFSKIVDPIESAKISKNLFFDNDIFFQIKKKDFRRMKWSSYHNRCQTAMNGDENLEIDEKKYCRKFKDIKFMKKELIPQTKACNISKNSKVPNSALRIKGIIKDISLRKKQKSYS